VPTDDQGTNGTLGKLKSWRNRGHSAARTLFKMGQREVNQRGSAWDWSDYGWSFREESAL